MSLSVHRGIYPPPTDRVNYPASAEHCLTLHVANSDRAEMSLNNGKRRRSKTYSGEFTFIPAQCSSEWLWEESVELLEIYLPPSLLNPHFSQKWRSRELKVLSNMEFIRTEAKGRKRQSVVRVQPNIRIN